jgi:hypothetical protein
MANVPYIYGSLASRDLFDQIAQYMYEVVKPYKMFGYVSGVFGGSYGTIPMQSAGATYYWPYRQWIFSGRIDVGLNWTLYNFFFLAVDRNNAPLYGMTILMKEPVSLPPGMYDFRIEYSHTPDQFFTVDVPCMNPSNMRYAEYLCPI